VEPTIRYAMNGHVAIADETADEHELEGGPTHGAGIGW
jgi:hypothetical protein